MKQKKINDILYVFDITPYQITEDTDAEVIKVQEECVAGFKELNESLADKIVAYNYHVACVQVPEWAPYVDEPDPTPKEDPELARSAESATVTIGADDNVFPTLSNPHSVTVNYASGDESAATINESTGQITLVAAGSTTIYANFAGDDTYEAQTVSYVLTVEAAAVDTYTVYTANLYGHATLKINGETISDWGFGEVTGVADNSVVDIYPTENTSYYINRDSATWDTDHWTYTVNGEDLVINIDYVGPEITITLDAQNLTSENVTVKHNGEEVQLAGSYTGYSGEDLTFWPLEDPTYYTASNMNYDDTVGQEHWWYSIGNEDATIGLTYTAPQNNEEQPE